MLKLGFGSLWLSALRPLDAWAQGDPASLAPQEGDVLVTSGDAAKPLTLADIPLNGKFVAAWAMEPTSKLVRSANRLHELVLIRVDPTGLTGESLSNAASGVLAFSALCPHAGCDVSTWVPEEGVLSCDCHGSEFDVKAAGKVTVGPALRSLPPLALKLDGDVLVVARPFAAAIRFDEA